LFSFRLERFRGSRSGRGRHLTKSLRRKKKARERSYQFEVATIIAGKPSAICLISALFHYGLTDVVPKKTWIMVPNEKRSRNRELKLHRARTPDWNIGIVKHKGYSVTSVERTIVEAICYRHKLGSTIGVEALRKSVQSQKTNLSKVMDMAKKLGVLPRLIPYIEALAT